MTLKLKDSSVLKEDKTPGADDVVEETNTPTPEEVAAQEKEELARLKRENAELKEKEESSRSQPTTAASPKVTAAYLRGLNETQREFVEKQTGMSFNDVVTNVEAQENAEARSQTTSIQARAALRDAIDEEVDRNPQVSKLRSHIREYFADVSDAEKADPVAMKRHMKKALTYAKGAAGVQEVRPGRVEVRTAGPGEDGGEPVFDPKSGDIKPGKYSLNDGFSLEIQDLIPKDKREKMKHPDRPGGIMIAPDYEEPPRFR